MYLDLECKAQESDSPGTKYNGEIIILVTSIVCCITIGVLLGVVGLYLIRRVKSRLPAPTAPSSPPPVTYEEVDMVKQVNKSQDIQLTSNEA